MFSCWYDTTWRKASRGKVGIERRSASLEIFHGTLPQAQQSDQPECHHLDGWDKATVTYATISKSKMVSRRDIAGERRRRRRTRRRRTRTRRTRTRIRTRKRTRARRNQPKYLSKTPNINTSKLPDKDAHQQSKRRLASVAKIHLAVTQVKVPLGGQPHSCHSPPTAPRHPVANTNNLTHRSDKVQVRVCTRSDN